MNKIKGLRWWIVGLVALATIINYIDRNALGILWPEISKDFDLDADTSKKVYADISTLFLISYAVSKGLSGRLFDIIGTRLGFVFSIVVWSISAALHAVAKGAASFEIFRVFLGIGEAGNWSGATKANAEWFPIKERALAQGIFNSGASLGAIISAPLIALMFGWVGWRFTFVIIGGLGLLWLIPWLLIHKAGPDKNSLLTEAEREYILNGQKVEGEEEKVEEEGLSWRELLSYKESWAVLISRFLLDPIWWMFVIWLPIYLNDVFGFEVKEIGAFAWVPYVGAALGSIFGGWFVSVLIKQGWSVSKARKWVITGAGIIMLPGLLVGATASDPIFAMILIAIVLFGFQVAIGNIQTLPSDYFSGKSVGSLAGLGGSAAALGSVLLSTRLIPWLTDLGTGPDGVINYLPVFILGALLVPCGILAILTLGGNIKRVDLK